MEKYLRDKLLPFPELSWEELKKEPQLAKSYEEIAFSELKFSTPSGKIELYSEKAVETWGVSALPDYVPPVEFDNNSEFQINLMSPNTKNRIHSQFGNLESIKMIDPKPLAYIHSSLAHKFSIENGQQIRVFNNRGEIFIEAKFDNGMYPQAVLIHNGWQLLNQNTSPNLLSAGRETDMGHGTAFHDNMVAIEKV